MSATTTTTAEFLETIRKSGLLLADQLDRYNDNLPEEAKDLAVRMIRDGLITKFQAQMLLKGKQKGFIIRDKYKILDLLGVGGMGRVFLCEHLLLKRRMAVKTLNSKHLKDPSSIERFLREARLVAALDHVNIVRVYDIERDGDVPLMAMEYVEGKTLQSIVDHDGPLTQQQAVNYVTQACRGLKHAHDAGIIHRDIKPGNLLLDLHGTVKILDLGLGRFQQRDKNEGLTERFDSNSVLGTADYLAPEQAVNSSTVDRRADLYALGGTLYFLLTGHTPFDAPTVAEKLLAHQVKPVPSLRDVYPLLPNGLDEVFRKIMAKDPKDRPQSAEELAEELAPWMEDAVPLPNVEFEEGSEPTEKAKRSSQRIVSPSSGPMPSSGGLQFDAPETTSGAREKTVRKKAQPKAKEPLPPWIWIVATAAFVLIGVLAVVLLSGGKTEPVVAKKEETVEEPKKPVVVAVAPAEPKVTPKKVEPKVTPKKVEPKVEPKVVPMPEPKVEPVPEPKVEPKVEPMPEPKAMPKEEDPMKKDLTALPGDPNFKPDPKMEKTDPKDPPKMEPKEPAKGEVLAPEKVKEYVGKDVMVEFTVVNSKQVTGLVLLNSMANFSDPANFTAVLPKNLDGKLEGKAFADWATFYKGKKLQVSGKVEMRNGTAQIKVLEAANIKIVP